MESFPPVVAAALRPENIATAIIAMNFFAFAAFGIDKARAEQGAWRISEDKLLALALFGGIIGAYAGRHLFRHKTRKHPFCDHLEAIAFCQIVGVAALIVYVLFGEELGLLFDL
jgi:uncharacterized membrane protein YsdA (DUF1294 family)